MYFLKYDFVNRVYVFIVSLLFIYTYDIKNKFLSVFDKECFKIYTSVKTSI